MTEPLRQVLEARATRGEPRGQSAVLDEALRAAHSSHPGPGAHRERVARARAVAIVVAAVAVTVGSYSLLRAGVPRSTSKLILAASDTDVRPLLPVWMPDGAELVSASGAKQHPVVDGSAWRRTTDESYLVALTYDRPIEFLDNLAESRMPVEIGGVTMQFAERDRFGLGLSSLMSTAGGQTTLYLSSGAPVADLRAFAQGLTPSGYERIYRGDMSACVRVSTGEGDTNLTYLLGDGRAVRITVVSEPTALPGPYGWLNMRPMPGADDALISDTSALTSSLLASTSVGVVRVTAVGLSNDEMYRIAKSMTTVSLEDWDRATAELPVASGESMRTKFGD